MKAFLAAMVVSFLIGALFRSRVDHLERWIAAFISVGLCVAYFFLNQI